jgi:predicted phosphodiesterase
VRIGVVSDIHANLSALNSVLKHMDSQGVDKKAYLGDMVGFGPYPNECIEMIIDNFNYITVGSYDKASFNTEGSIGLDMMSKEAIEWTNKNTSKGNLEFLENLIEKYKINDEILISHKSPYLQSTGVLSDTDAMLAFNSPVEDFNISFIGSTHIPCIWELSPSNELLFIKPNFNNGSSYEIEIPENNRAIINVGSAGQPKDSDPRACYVIYDTDTRKLTFFRILYPIEMTISRMQRLGLSDNLWLRLMYGQ